MQALGSLALIVGVLGRKAENLPDAESLKLGVGQIFGLSTQDTDYQREAAERLHLPFPIVSDAELKFTRALNLPTFVAAGQTLLKRMALVIDDGLITKVFYPVFPPDQSAAEVIAWLKP